MLKHLSSSHIKLLKIKNFSKNNVSKSSELFFSVSKSYRQTIPSDTKKFYRKLIEA